MMGVMLGVNSRHREAEVDRTFGHARHYFGGVVESVCIPQQQSANKRACFNAAVDPQKIDDKSNDWGNFAFSAARQRRDTGVPGSLLFWANPHGRRQLGKRGELALYLSTRRVGPQSKRLCAESGQPGSHRRLAHHVGA
jgi:hypothetical protein